MDPKRSPHLLLPGLLGVIVAVYTAVGALYAALTPTWQVPDEPAHYNYVRALAECHGLPVMEPGDYDQAYLDRLREEGFPPHLSIEPLRYEDHQPPLYYLLAAPVYLLFDGAVLPLRLLAVLFGAGLLVVAFGTVRAIFPSRPELALMSAAFIAFIPQHVAMTAGVENDALGELVAGVTLWALVAYVGGCRERPRSIGLLLGTALLTKTTIYAVLGVAGVAVMLRRQRERRTWHWAGGQLAYMLVPAVLLSAPWFVRNGLVYGWHDLTGVARHNAVVAGQPRSSEWLVAYGWGGLLSRMIRTTFQSFWGQFGWMAVPLPTRFYRVLALFSVVLAGGFLGWSFDRRRPRLSPAQRARLIVCLALFLLIGLEFLAYNLIFVQHQGRYLYPALIPMGIAVALGLNWLAGFLPRRARPWAVSIPFVGLAVLDVYCLFRFVIPFLTR